MLAWRARERGGSREEKHRAGSSARGDPGREKPMSQSPPQTSGSFSKRERGAGMGGGNGCGWEWVVAEEIVGTNQHRPGKLQRRMLNKSLTHAREGPRRLAGGEVAREGGREGLFAFSKKK